MSKQTKQTNLYGTGLAILRDAIQMGPEVRHSPDTNTDHPEHLTFRRVVRREEGAAPTADQRRRLVRITAEYRDRAGYEYRKSFESYSEPLVPLGGLHSDLNKLARQW